MRRLDRLLGQYDKERDAAATPEQFRQAARHLVQAIDALQDKTQIELWIRSFFVGLS